MRALTPFAFSPPPVAAYEPEARILLSCARHWVIIARGGRSPRCPLMALLGASAARFSLLMDLLVTAWPETFTTYPPCAQSLSPDEHCLMTLLAAADAGDQALFHSHFADLLAQEERTRLWTAASRLMGERIGLN
jgi:hypothetical protein